MAEVISSLDTKVRELIARYESLKKENVALKEALAQKDELLHSTNNKLEQLEKQTDKLRLKDAFLGMSADPAAAKKKVSQLIKEIDSCIKLLND